jgi:hypothetical protein
VELPPRDADHSPARSLESAVARAVSFEGVSGGVCRVAVELDDEAMLRPDAIDLQSFDDCVGLR